MYVFYPFSAQRIFSRLVISMLIIIILLAGVSGTQAVHAAGGTAHFSMVPGVIPHSNEIRRGYFTYTGKPGLLIHDGVHVTNVGTARGSVNLYAVDATTDQASGVTFLAPADPRHDVGAWITLSSQKITLNPGQSQDVPFSLQIPNKVRAGQHGGGIIAADTTNQAVKSNVGAVHATIQVHRQEILGVLVNLPGTLMQKLNITGITYNQKNTSQSLLIRLANTGTQMLHPSGSLQITDKKRHLLQNVPLKLAAILPQTAINYPVTIARNALNTGTYTASVSLKYEGGHSAKYEARFEARFIELPAQLSTGQTIPKSTASPLLPKTGADHPMQHAIAHDVTSNRAFFESPIPWQYIAGILVIMILLATPFLWRRRLVSRRRFFGERNAQKRL